MRRDRVDMPLAANRLLPDISSRERNHPEQQMPAPQFSGTTHPANIHADAIERIRTGALRIKQARSYRIERTQLRVRSEDTGTKLEIESIYVKRDLYAGIKDGVIEYIQRCPLQI